SSRREKAADALGNITYSLIVGAMLDYSAGLDWIGILGSRGFAMAVNIPTSIPYGKWRNFLFNKTKTSDKKTRNLGGKIRRGLVDLLAFNTFQVPVYATAVAVGSYLSEGEVNWEKVQQGTEYLACISPLIGPTMGWYMDGFRNLFGVKTAPQKAEA
ncbi:MAG: L-alanine exporter AlaE, partial [Nanoarchaeota archaeon]|nr:L-alanine exporter AlaE [Nanoarchaeota archaeon]